MKLEIKLSKIKILFDVKAAKNKDVDLLIAKNAEIIRSHFNEKADEAVKLMESNIRWQVFYNKINKK